MAENSAIEWCDHTFNPWTGCTKVSPGCDHCYAESWAKRSGTVTWGVEAPRRRTTEANWRLPLKWNRQAGAGGRRYRVFCASLADVFDNAVDPAWRAALFALIASTPHLDWLLLTKRIGNVQSMIEAPGMQKCGLPPNVWLGATVVNQEEADRDIPKLLATPVRVRFLSIEPMLGPIDLTAIPWGGLRTNILCGWTAPEHGIHWVICGGESGPHARPMHPDWARSLRDQCAAAGVPFLFKQWGEWAPHDGRPGADLGGQMRRGTAQLMHAPGNPEGFFRKGDAFVERLGKKFAGRLLDGVQHDGFPTSAVSGTPPEAPKGEQP